ncbi:MAG: hypothetical protein ABJF23_23365 [Bryobacteraceae bacterium]
MAPFLLATILLFKDQDVTGAVKLPVPSVQYRMNVASATTAPWVNANGWLIQRNAGKQVFYDLPKGGAELAMAEAHAYNADALVKIAPEDADAYAKMNAFLQQLGPAGPQIGNVAVVDDGSAQAGEGLNLLHRKNLLYRMVSSPDPKADLNIKVDKSITNPLDFAAEVREKLTDDKRLVRIYGSAVVLANLTGDARGRMQLHLINYGRRPVDGLRIRLRGSYVVRRANIYESADAKVTEFINRDGGTEFSIPRVGLYSVIDLEAK